MKTWCCEWLQLMIDSYGEKGFSIIAFSDDSCNFRSFYLTSRAFDQEILLAFKDDQISWPSVTNKSGKAVPLAGAVELRIPIDNCPRCGKKLAPLIKKNRPEFDRLSRHHDSLEKTLY